MAFALLLTAAAPSAAAVVDRIVAFVDDEPILASEVRAAIAACLVPPLADEAPAATEARALEALIDERLRSRDVARFGEPVVSGEEVQSALAEQASACGGSAAELVVAARRVGLRESRLRDWVRARIANRRSAQDRFGGAIFITEDEIHQFYETDPELTTRLLEVGVVERPPLDAAMREMIRDLLSARRLDARLAQWIAELRATARISRPAP